MYTTPICLLIDDDDDDEEIFKAALKELDGHIECIVAKDERQAFEILEDPMNDIPDFIFLDLHLPQTNGIECLLKIKKIPHLRHVPVYIYTSVANSKLEMESRKLGAADFIIKPSSISSIKDILRKIIS